MRVPCGTCGGASTGRGAGRTLDDESESEGTTEEPRDDPMLTLAREPSGPLSRSEGLEEVREAPSGCARVGESLLVGSGGSARSTSAPRGKCASEGVRTVLSVSTEGRALCRLVCCV